MVHADAGLRPLAGSSQALQTALDTWLADPDPTPISVLTSGSTGEPKQVVLSRRAVLASAEAAIERLGGAGQWILALPAHYVAGMQVVVRSSLAGAAAIALGNHAGIAEAMSAMSHSRRYVSLVPTQLHRLLDQPVEAAALAEFDAVLLGGSSVRSDLLARARDRGIRVVTTYGMSETSGGCVYDGVALEGVAVRVDERSRVLISGDVLFDGYAGQPAMTAEVLRDGWLHTPDLGRIDERGRLQILGRADDVVVSGGVNVPLPAVETRLLDHPSIAQVAVVGSPDPEWGMRVVAVVVPRPDQHVELTELRDFVGAFHPREWAPRELVVAPALPMLASGKIDRQALRRHLAGATAHG